MTFLRGGRKTKLFIGLASAFLVLTLIFLGCGIYLGDYYKANEDEIAAFDVMNQVEYEVVENGNVVFWPKDRETDVGFIFYPGGKVEKEAYKPLMASLAVKGVLCILVDMPYNLAILDINAAEGITKQFKQINEWYIGGHSLGGAASSMYLEKNSKDYKGLVLLGAYSTSDLSSTELKVLSVYGSEDLVMDRNKYEECRSNLPKGYTERVLEGGCHGYFGVYGAQAGDGTPSISNEDQIYLTSDIICEFIFEKE